MMKCAVCNTPVEETFLKKPLGTYVKDARGKHIICFACQKRFPAKDAQIAQIK